MPHRMLLFAALTACHGGDKDDTATTTLADDTGGTVATAAGDLLWLVTGGGASEDSCGSAVEAGTGSLVATCMFHGFATWGEETDLVGEGDVDAVLLGLDPADGALQWALQVGSTGEEHADAAASVALTDGRVATLLGVGGPLSLTGADLEAAEAGELALVVVDGSGAVSASARLIAGAPYWDVLAWSLSPLSNGGLLVAGGFEGDLTVLPGSSAEQAFTAAGDLDGILLWLDADLQLERSLQLSAPGGEVIAQAVATDQGVLLGGYLFGTLDLTGIVPLSLNSREAPDGGDAFVAALDAQGEPLWGLTFGSDGSDYARSLAPTADGGIVLTGYYGYDGDAGVLQVPGLEGMDLEGDPGGSSDVFVASFDSAGVPRWLSGFSTPEIDIPIAIDAFDDGAVVVSAWASRDGAATTLDFTDGEVGDLPGLTDVLVRYEADGSRGWTRQVSDSYALGVHVLADQSVVQAHSFLSGAVFGAGEPGELIPPSAGTFDAALSKHAP